MKNLFEEYPVLDNGNVCLKKLTNKDLEGIKKMILCEEVYRYVPPFVPERQCNGDIEYFINNMCEELFNDKIEMILGIYLNNEFCGLLELYHYDSINNQISIGARINKEYWNKGLSNEFLSLIIKYLFNETNITTICASNMVDNISSGKSLEKNGFTRVNEGALEDWGFQNNVPVDKWVLKKVKKEW